MHRRLTLVAALLLLAAVSIPNPCLADRPTPRIGTSSGPVHEVVLGQKLPSVASTCFFGSPGPGAYPMYYLYLPNDPYDTLLDPAQCPCR